MDRTQLDTSESYSSSDAAIRIQRSVNSKRLGQRLEPQLARAIIMDFLRGEVADYQMSAWLATLAAVNMDIDEVVGLTHAYLADTATLDLSRLPHPIVDKHSTGGVGDKTTLVVGPLVAACGATVVKMSGRGLGFAGGTIDKLESIPGMRINLSPSEMLEIAGSVGLVVTGQSPDLAPGDEATYRIRDITGTVESLPLIAASIMSKKLAVGADALVLDVKVGDGALITDPEHAKHLADMMIAIGERTGLRTRAVLGDMSQPLGRAVGNSLEVEEAVKILRGSNVPGLTPMCVDLAAEMLCAGDPSLTKFSALGRVQTSLSSGNALEKFRSWIVAQGGSPAIVDNPDSMPQAPRTPVFSQLDGWVTSVSARAVGSVAMAVGAGRRRKHDKLDHLAGVVVHKRVGDPIVKGEVLAELATARTDRSAYLRALSAAFQIGPAPMSEQISQTATP